MCVYIYIYAATSPANAVIFETRREGRSKRGKEGEERERGKEKLGDGARNGVSKMHSQHNVRKDEWRRTREITRKLN